MHKPYRVKTIVILIFCIAGSFAHAQQKSFHFGPGFDPRESDDMLCLNYAFMDTTKDNRFEGYLEGYQFKYRSPSVGLDNKWDLWIREDSTVAIMLRGTTADAKSLLADFYCAMLPAKGQIVIAKGDTIQYKLAEYEGAAVHAGFLAGFAYLSHDIAPKLDSLYKAGYHNFIISGHSQGGSLCYYVSAWLWYLKKDGIYPLLNVKTYASAATKVGNMYFVYDYDNINHAQWSFSIINSSDPVPELPFTTQQVEADMNTPNPIMNMYKRFNDLPLLKRIFLKCTFNKMRKRAVKSSQAYQKYLGGYSAKFIKNMVPSLEMPKAVNSTYYMRPGITISLLTNTNYFKYFEDMKNVNYFHHGMDAYRFLLREYYDGLKKMTRLNLKSPAKL